MGPFKSIKGHKLTQCTAALRARAHTLVLREVEPQPVIPYGAGDVTQVVHQVSAQRTVQQGVPQRRRRAKNITGHGRGVDGRWGQSGGLRGTRPRSVWLWLGRRRARSVDEHKHYNKGMTS